VFGVSYSNPDLC